MISSKTRRTVLAAAAISTIFAGGTAFAATDLMPPPQHVGPPAEWGPLLEELCSSPERAEAFGYHVIEGDNFANEIVGGPLADAIFGYGGNDLISGGPNDDIICGGFGDDDIRGSNGRDALYGEAHGDRVLGQESRDFVDGGGQTDVCNGGEKLDAADDCETTFLVP
jgi:hypothetical protein